MRKGKKIHSLLVFLWLNLFGEGRATSVISARPSLQTWRLMMKGILADPRFAYPNYLAWWDRLWSRVAHWIARLKWRHPPRRLPFERFWDNFWNWLGLLLLIMLPFALAFFLPRLFHWEKRLQRIAPLRQPDLPDAGLMLKKAALLAEQGRTREAIRHVYLAVLEHFMKQGFLRNGSNISDKESLMLLHKFYDADSLIYGAFAKLVRLFQEKWYGLKDCLPSDYDNAVALAAIILESAGKRHG